jgi:hypothetical protein
VPSIYAHSERLQYFAHCSKAAGLGAFLRHCFRNLTQTSITFHAVFDFEKMVCGLISIVLSIIKSVRRL